MKRTYKVGTISSLFAAALIFAGCNGLQDLTGVTDTNISSPPLGTDKDLEISSIRVPYTEMVQVNNTDVTIQGQGSAGAFISNRTVSLSPYQIGKYEVSRRLYMEVMSRMYDDLEANGYKFSSPVASNEENAEGKKAASFVEFLGGQEVKVRNSAADFYKKGPGDYLGDTDFSNPDYFAPQNLDLPMGGLQWHDAIIFTNYLSLLTGKTPYYSLRPYLAIQYQNMNMDKTKHYVKFGDEGESLYLYDGESGRSSPTADRDSNEARRNPVSWLMASHWKTPYTGVGQADLLALVPPVLRTETYTLENALTNQRIDIDRTADGYRLPTEAEWEFAARGGSTTAADWRYSYSGSGTSSLTVANTSGSPVTVNGTGYTANRLGIYHMSGNISEWVWDFKGFDNSLAKSRTPSWTMQTIATSSGTERDPISQKGDLAKPGEEWVYTDQNAWRPADRIQRGGSYRDGTPARKGEIFVTARMGRTKINGGNSRDGFNRYWETMHNGVTTNIYGVATQASPEAVLDSGLRLAQGVQSGS